MINRAFSLPLIINNNIPDFLFKAVLLISQQFGKVTSLYSGLVLHLSELSNLAKRNQNAKGSFLVFLKINIFIQMVANYLIFLLI